MYINLTLSRCKNKNKYNLKPLYEYSKHRLGKIWTKRIVSFWSTVDVSIWKFWIGSGPKRRSFTGENFAIIIHIFEESNCSYGLNVALAKIDCRSVFGKGALFGDLFWNVALFERRMYVYVGISLISRNIWKWYCFFVILLYVDTYKAFLSRIHLVSTQTIGRVTLHYMKSTVQRVKITRTFP